MAQAEATEPSEKPLLMITPIKASSAAPAPGTVRAFLDNCCAGPAGFEPWLDLQFVTAMLDPEFQARLVEGGHVRTEVISAFARDTRVVDAAMHATEHLLQAESAHTAPFVIVVYGPHPTSTRDVDHYHESILGISDAVVPGASREDAIDRAACELRRGDNRVRAVFSENDLRRYLVTLRAVGRGWLAAVNWDEELGPPTPYALEDPSIPVPNPSRNEDLGF